MRPRHLHNDRGIIRGPVNYTATQSSDASSAHHFAPSIRILSLHPPPLPQQKTNYQLTACRRLTIQRPLILTSN